MPYFFDLSRLVLTIFLSSLLSLEDMHYKQRVRLSQVPIAAIERFTLMHTLQPLSHINIDISMGKAVAIYSLRVTSIYCHCIICLWNLEASSPSWSTLFKCLLFCLRDYSLSPCLLFQTLSNHNAFLSYVVLSPTTYWHIYLWCSIGLMENSIYLLLGNSQNFAVLNNPYQCSGVIF